MSNEWRVHDLRTKFWTDDAHSDLPKFSVISETACRSNKQALENAIAVLVSRRL